MSQQVYDYLTSSILIMLNTVFEVSASILLAFVIRELTHANMVVNLKSKLNSAYFVIAVFVALVFYAAVVDGLRSNLADVSIIFIRVVFYVIVNIFLGIFYFWQGYAFLKKFSRTEKTIKKENVVRIGLTKIALLNSIVMIIFGVFVSFLSIPSIFGTVWGNFGTYAVILFLTQFGSAFEILIFGGVNFNLKRFKSYVHFSVQSQNANRFTEDIVL